MYNVQCLLYKPVSNHFVQGGGEVKFVSRGDCEARKKTLKTFVLITFKNSASYRVFALLSYTFINTFEYCVSVYDITLKSSGIYAAYIFLLVKLTPPTIFSLLFYK